MIIKLEFKDTESLRYKPITRSFKVGDDSFEITLYYSPIADTIYADIVMDNGDEYTTMPLNQGVNLLDYRFNFHERTLCVMSESEYLITDNVTPENFEKLFYLFYINGDFDASNEL